MRKLNTLIAFTAIAFFTGCGNSVGDKSSETNLSLDKAKFPVNQTIAAPVNNNAPANNVTLNPGNATQPVANPVTVSSQGLNPAHGQPGHRCDIAVGAPLDSKPTTPAITTTAPVTAANNSNPVIIKPAETKPVISTIPVTPASNTNTAASGLNPAHGQPGHRCDIAVGAPLNSKPTTQPTVVTQPAVQPENTTTTQQPVTTTASKETTPLVIAPGMNPEHGKPGHRCDIAVGAPLNSAPVNNTPKKD